MGDFGGEKPREFRNSAHFTGKEGVKLERNRKHEKSIPLRDDKPLKLGDLVRSGSF